MTNRKNKLASIVLISTFALSSLIATTDVQASQENYHINISATTEDTKRPVEFDGKLFNFKLVGQTDLKEYQPTAFSKNKVSFTNMPRQKYKVIFQTPNNFAIRPDRVSALIPQGTPDGLTIFKSGDILDQNNGTLTDLNAYIGIYEDTHTPFIESAYEKQGRLEGRVFMSKELTTPEPSGTKVTVMSESRRVLGQGTTKTDGTFDIRLDTNNSDYRTTRYYIIEATDPFGRKAVYDYRVDDNYRSDLKISDIREGDRYVEGKTDSNATVKIYRNNTYLDRVTAERNGDFKLRIDPARYGDKFEFIMERRNFHNEITVIKRVGTGNSEWNPTGKVIYYDGNRRYYYDANGNRVYEDTGYRPNTSSNGYYIYDRYGNKVYITNPSVHQIAWQRHPDGRDYFDQGTTRYFRDGDRVYYEKNGTRYYVNNFSPILLQNHNYVPNSNNSPSFNSANQNLNNNGIVSKVYQNRGPYIGGFGDGTFRPNQGITRAELATFLYRIAGNADVYQKQAFVDTNHHWARNAIKWASNANVMNGYGDGTFRPDQVVTRAEMVATLGKFVGVGAYQKQAQTKFYDVSPNHWASGIIKLYADNNILNGYGDGSFRPDKMVTRAEAVAIINKVVRRSPSTYNGVRLTFRDVPKHHWAYNGILQATN